MKLILSGEGPSDLGTYILTENGKELSGEDIYIDARGKEHKASDYTPDQIKKALERNQLRLK
jgi:hypothetical protein